MAKSPIRLIFLHPSFLIKFQGDYAVEYSTDLTIGGRVNLRNKEEFQDALICQYRDLIHEALLESETDHKTGVDLSKLNSKLRVICKAAEYDGLNKIIINQLIDEVMPNVAVSKAA
jgi:hypothetical protein